jgi:predicted HicB family RNase H-like nuclease
MAAQKGKSAPKPKRTHVSASVRLDVATHARVSAAAALAGVDKSTWMSRAITEALQGIVVFDRRKGAGQGDLSDGDESTEAA